MIDGREPEPGHRGPGGGGRGARPGRSTTCWRGPATRTSACVRSGSTPPARPAPTGVISSKGSTNFAHAGWRGFDVRGALETGCGCPSSTTTTATRRRSTPTTPIRADAPQRSSVSAIVGTGLGGGVIEKGRVIKGAPGMAGELGHVHIPLHGLIGRGPADAEVQLRVRGRRGERRLAHRDREEPAAVLAVPFPEHALARPSRSRRRPSWCAATARRATRWRCAIFEQQAQAIGRLFTIAANFTDPDAYFIGGGVVEAAPQFREWFLAQGARAHRRCARSRRARPGSRSYPTSTWPARAARRSPRSSTSTRQK